MFRKILFAAGLVLVSLVGQAQNNLLIKKVSVVSSEREVNLTKVYVLVENDVITYIGKKKPKYSKSTHKVINGKGKYLTPGLIDSHVHLANMPGIKNPADYPELEKKYYEQLGKSYLYFGYTTLIDPNNYAPRIVEQVKNGKYHPDIYTCSKQLSIANGFGMAYEPQEGRFRRNPNFLYDQYNPIQPKEDFDKSLHSPEVTVKRIVEQGGICVKTLYEDGFGGTEDVTWQMPSLQIIKDVVTASHKNNIPVLLHASSYEAQRFALQSGVDVIAHGMWHWGDLGEFLFQSDLPKAHRSLLQEIARKQVGYQPTFRVIGAQRDVFDKNFLNDPNLKHVYPAALIDWMKSHEGQWQYRQLKGMVNSFLGEKSDEEAKAVFQLIVDKIRISAGILAQNNAKFMLGTDTPAMASLANPPGYNGYLEMKEWHEAGISLKQIFNAATIENAKVLHLDQQYGTVEVGKIANLILMSKNPLEDFSAYNAIHSVIIRGQLHKREELSATAK